MDLVTASLPRVSAAGEGGLLDAGAWESVAPLAELVDARHGGTPRDRTALRAAAGPHALHVRFECDDRDVWATLAHRDDPLWEEEVVEIFVAPGRADPQRYVEIEVSPAGVLFDALVHSPDGRRETMTVDPAWTVAGLVAKVARPRESRWIAELAIPWAALRALGDPAGAWRANFYRVERPHGEPAEYSAWAPTGAEPADFHRPSRFGLLETP